MARRIIAVVAQQLKISFEWIPATEGRKCRSIVVGHRVVHAPNDCEMNP